MLEYKREDEARIIQNLILGSETWNSVFALSLRLECPSLSQFWVMAVPSLPSLFLPLAQSLSASAVLVGGLRTLGY